MGRGKKKYKTHNIDEEPAVVQTRVKNKIGPKGRIVLSHFQKKKDEQGKKKI